MYYLFITHTHTHNLKITQVPGECVSSGVVPLGMEGIALGDIVELGN